MSARQLSTNKIGIYVLGALFFLLPAALVGVVVVMVLARMP